MGKNTMWVKFGKNQLHLIKLFVILGESLYRISIWKDQD